MKKNATHLKYGGLIGLAMVIIGLIIYIADKDMKSNLGLIVYLPFIAGLIMNAIAFSKANDHYVTFGSVFGSGFKATAVVAIIMVAWTYISILIFPEMKTKGLEIAYESMANNPSMTEEMVDEWMVRMDKYYGVMTAGFILFGLLFWGAIISLLGAAVAKKKGEGFPQA